MPRTAARGALAQGRLEEARAQLERRVGAGASQEAADAARLALIADALQGAPGDAAKAVHRAFAAALANEGPQGFLSQDEWFALYARCLARALESEPARGHRGWLGAHFAFAGGAPEAARRAALRIVEGAAPGSAWLEAARLALQLDGAADARGWIHSACLEAGVELDPSPPPLEPCGVRALDAAPRLPALPAPVEDAFDAARALDGLPGPWIRWVAVVGEIDRALAPAATAAGGADADTADAENDPPRAFLAALRAARRARERDRRRGAGGCSDRELRARRRMAALAPALLDRYVRGVQGGLL